jgi:lauroyl/myristoyl acyltransferase
MNKQEIRTKLLKRRKLLGIILTIIWSPVLFPLLFIYKLGEVCEKLADIIQKPALTIIDKNMKKYKTKLEQGVDVNE